MGVAVQVGAKPERVAARLVRGRLIRECQRAASAWRREIENEGHGCEESRVTRGVARIVGEGGSCRSRPTGQPTP